MDAVALAQSLIRCESVTPHEGGALTLLERTLGGLGFTCHRLRFEEQGTDPVENLYARFGTGSPHICFAGHSDVVPPGDASAWSIPPFAAEIRDGYLYGRGAEDMKSAIAAFIAAASDFTQARGKTFSGSISFLITGDEEGPAINGTRKMLRWLHERKETIDAVLVGEPTNPTFIGEMAKIGRRGSVTFRLSVAGKQGHVAYPQLADNPIPHLLRILHTLKARTLDTGTEFFPPSNLEITTIDVGNPAANVIPGSANARFNIRFNTTHTGEELVRWVQEICRESGATHTLDYQITAEPFFNPPGALSDLLCAAVKDATGHVPVLATTGGSSDARFITEYFPVVEFGATGATAHMVDERIEVADIALLTQIYSRVLERFFAG